MMNTMRARELADELDAIGAGTPQAAAPSEIGESADMIRALLAGLESAQRERDKWKRVAEAQVCTHQNASYLEAIRRADAADAIIASVEHIHTKSQKDKWDEMDAEFGSDDYRDRCTYDEEMWPCATITALRGGHLDNRPTDPGTRLVRDFNKDRGGGYLIESNGKQYRWVWCEPNEEPEFGEWTGKESDAIRAAAVNWDECGSGRREYLAMLRREATKSESAGR